MSLYVCDVRKLAWTWLWRTVRLYWKKYIICSNIWWYIRTFQILLIQIDARLSLCECPTFFFQYPAKNHNTRRMKRNEANITRDKWMRFYFVLFFIQIHIESCHCMRLWWKNGEVFFYERICSTLFSLVILVEWHPIESSYSRKITARFIYNTEYTHTHSQTRSRLRSRSHS